MHRSRRVRLALLVATGLLFAACGSSGGSDGASTTEAGGGSTTAPGKTLSVCSDIPYEPFEFEGAGPDGLKYTGFDVELLNAIAKTANDKLSIKVVGFDGILGNIAAGDCDIAMSSITITDDRAKKVLFSDPYFDADQSLMVTKESGYTSLDDLKDKTIGVQSGTTGETYANDHKPDGATIKSFEGADGLFSAIKAGEIQAVLQDFPVNAYRATKDPTLSVAATCKTNEQYGFAVAKDDTALKNALDDGLTKIKDDGTYDSLYLKYFGTKPPGT